VPSRCPSCELTLHTPASELRSRCPRCSAELEPIVNLAAAQALKREFADRDSVDLTAQHRSEVQPRSA
jgi:uncharacterized protein with PIN domain